MNLTYLFDFRGAWPVGAYLAVTAPNLETAVKLAKSKVKTAGYRPETVTLLKDLDPNAVEVYIISEGEY